MSEEMLGAIIGSVLAIVLVCLHIRFTPHWRASNRPWVVMFVLAVLYLFLSLPCFGQTIVTRPVQVGTTPPLQSLVTGWMTLAPMRQVSISPPELADIESRMPAGHIYRDADLVTWAHETTHGINSRCRVWAGAGMNAFYCLDGNVAIFREPRITKSNVCRYVPANLRGDVFGLYMAGQQSWDSTPLYILDEWVAYINGAYVAVQLDKSGKNTGRSTLHDIAKSVEFAGYASALLCCIDQHDHSYADRDKLAKFIAFNIERTLWLARQSNVQPHVDAFAVAYVQGGSSACASGNCQTWSWGQGQWRPATQQPIAKNPPSRPQTPARPPSNPPAVGAAGCQCKGGNVCKCDQGKIASLELRICQLEALVESGKLKGPKGDKGDAGPAGVAGPIGPQGKAALPNAVVSAPVEIIRPDGTKKQLLWPLDGKHGLRLPLNTK